MIEVEGVPTTIASKWGGDKNDEDHNVHAKEVEVKTQATTAGGLWLLLPWLQCRGNLLLPRLLQAVRGYCCHGYCWHEYD